MKILTYGQIQEILNIEHMVVMAGTVLINIFITDMNIILKMYLQKMLANISKMKGFILEEEVRVVQI